MKLEEAVAAARRIGPIKAVDGSLAPVSDFSPVGAKLISVNNGAFAAAVGDVVQILNPDDSPSGFVYYQATPTNAVAQGMVTLRLADVCLERVFTEWVEPLPQGIPAGTADDNLLHVPLEAKDVDGNPVTSAVGLELHISINGAKLEVPANSLFHLGNGLWDLLLDPSEATDIGWVFVRLGGSCQEFAIRVTVVDPENLTASEAGDSPPTAPTLPEADAVGIGRVAGDLALVWSAELVGDADLYVLDTDIDEDLATDRGLVTAALLSLFTDRRAEADDKPPSGDATDRRGWWGDQFAVVQGDRYGSRLWLLDRSKLNNETVLRAKEYVREGLAWMLEDRVVSGVDVTVETRDKTLLYAVGLQRPGKDPVTFRFAHAWQNLQEAA